MYAYKHHVIPLHEWKRRINPKAVRSNREFNAPDNVVWLTLEQHTQVHQRMGEEGSKWDRLSFLRMSGQIGLEEVTLRATKLANMGRKQTEEHRRKNSEAHFGKQYALGCKHPPRTEQQNIEKSLRQKGRPHRKRTPEENRANSERQKGKPKPKSKVNFV